MWGGGVAISREYVTVVLSGRGLAVVEGGGRVDGRVAWCAGVRGGVCLAVRIVLAELLTAGHGEAGHVGGAT